MNNGSGASSRLATRRRRNPTRATPISRPRRSRRKAASPTEPLPGPYATVGKDLGGLIGFAPLGERLGGAIGRLFGRGDYQVQSNSLMESYGKPAAGPPPPLAFRNGRRGVRIVEREYLGDVVSGSLSGSATVFTNSSYVINPALETTFPWLSKIARQFDQWEPNGIVFEFRSTSSEFNGSSQALGTIILSTDYDAVDTPYTSKVEAENSDYAMSVKASDCAVHGIECAPSERPTPVLFTRVGPRPSNTDPRMYDLGNFQICTQGMSVAGVNLGELWVSYDITFYKKQLSSTSPDSTELFSYTYDSTEASTTDYFGASQVTFKNWGNWDNTSFVTSNRYYLPPMAPMGSVFDVSFIWYGAAQALAAPTVSLTGCTELADDDLLYLAAAGTTNWTLSSTGFTQIRKFLKVTNPGNAYLTLSGGTLTDVTDCRTCLQQMGSVVPYNRQPIS